MLYNKTVGESCQWDGENDNLTIENQFVCIYNK